MAVMYFDETWDESRLQWEINRVNSEIRAYQQHVESLVAKLEKKRAAKAKALV